MNQKAFIQIPLLILIIGGLFLITQPTQAGFLDWFSWSKIKLFFFGESVEEKLPTSITQEKSQEIPEVIQLEALSEIPKEIIKEVPKNNFEQEITIQTLKNQIEILKGQIEIFEKQIEDLLSNPPEVELKEVIKEVPVEKIIIKEVLVPQTCPVCPICQQSTSQTEESLQPSFSIERVSLPNWPNNIFFRAKSEDGSFVFEAITLEVNNPYEVHVWNNNQSNLDFIQRQTLIRGNWNYRTCETMNSVFQEYSYIDYPYPCPISNSPLYISRSDEDWMGRPTNISLDPDLPFPQETEIYYYKVVEQNTGTIFEYIK